MKYFWSYMTAYIPVSRDDTSILTCMVLRCHHMVRCPRILRYYLQVVLECCAVLEYCIVTYKLRFPCMQRGKSCCLTLAHCCKRVCIIIMVMAGANHLFIIILTIFFLYNSCRVSQRTSVVR